MMSLCFVCLLLVVCGVVGCAPSWYVADGVEGPVSLLVFMFSKIVNILSTDANKLLDIHIENESNLIIETYNKLDKIDQAEIRGEMKQMLKADKYKKERNIPINAPSRKIAAHGADGTKQTKPPRPRKIT